MIGDALRSLAPNRVKEPVLNARLALRRPTSRIRLLPDFLVIGTLRGGTSSAFKYLGQHPCVVPSLGKEPWYFSRRYRNGPAWYRSHFPVRMRRELAARLRGTELRTFEASPDYLFHPYAPARAAELVPWARIVVLLRDPVDRAFSQYLHNVTRGREDLSFDQALAAEPERLAGAEERMHEDPLVDIVSYWRYSYFARGVYVDQLERWMDRFSRDSFLLVKSEDLYERTAETYDEIVAFLGLPQWRPASFPNYSRMPAGDSALFEHTRGRLAERYAPHNRRLYELVGRDFGWEGGR